MVLGPVHDGRGGAGADHRLPAARHHRAAHRSAPGPGHHRRGRRAARRGRGVRGQAPPGRGARHRRALLRGDPRLRDAQRPARDQRRRRGHQAGGLRPPLRPARLIRDAAPHPVAPEGRADPLGGSARPSRVCRPRTRGSTVR
ncbi:hypothetical protein SGPA1_10618 [Streptomyces misionensis JCM 4497]